MCHWRWQKLKSSEGSGPEFTQQIWPGGIFLFFSLPRGIKMGLGSGWLSPLSGGGVA